MSKNPTLCGWIFTYLHNAWQLKPSYSRCEYRPSGKETFSIVTKAPACTPSVRIIQPGMYKMPSGAQNSSTPQCVDRAEDVSDRSGVTRNIIGYMMCNRESVSKADCGIMTAQVLLVKVE